VIATGFEQTESVMRLSNAHQPTLVVEPVKKPALVAVPAENGASNVSEDLDRPTYMRRQAPARPVPEKTSLLVDDDWDVPTFLRRKAEN
ncbi:MAG: cell division protein FtsZ, partial [Nitrospirales bacterium]|nr:cell division protein FtsZ [Nitrospirales bacterium]